MCDEHRQMFSLLIESFFMGGDALPGAHPQVRPEARVTQAQPARGHCGLRSALEFNGDVLLIMCTRQMAQQGGGNCRLVEGGGGFDDHVVCGRQIHHFAVRGVNTRCNNQTSRPDHCGQPLTRKNRAPRSTRVRRTPLQKLSTSWIPTDTPGSRHSIPGAVQGVPQRRAAIPTVHCM